MKVTDFKETIEKIGEKLGPGDDWMPTLILQKDSGMAIVGLMLMENDEMKDICAFIMTGIISGTNPDAACFITTAWLAKVDAEKYGCEEEFLEAYRLGIIKRPSENPNRQEIVMALCIGVRGESDGETQMYGTIQRSKDKPPKIIKWDIMESNEADDKPSVGRFPDAMYRGFELADPEGNLGSLQELQERIKREREER